MPKLDNDVKQGMDYSITINMTAEVPQLSSNSLPWWALQMGRVANAVKNDKGSEILQGWASPVKKSAIKLVLATEVVENR